MDQRYLGRAEWKTGSACQIYSVSKKKWLDGIISRIFTDKEGEWLEVRYDKVKSKQIQRYSSGIRPHPDALKRIKRQKEQDVATDKNENIDNNNNKDIGVNLKTEEDNGTDFKLKPIVNIQEVAVETGHGNERNIQQTKKTLVSDIRNNVDSITNTALIKDEIDPINDDEVFRHRPVRAWRWDELESKWRRRGKGKLSICYNKQKQLGKIVFVDEKHAKTRLLQYIDGDRHAEYITDGDNENKQEVQWNGADYTMDLNNPMSGSWKVQFTNDQNAASQFLKIFNNYIDSMSGNNGSNDDEDQHLDASCTKPLESVSGSDDQRLHTLNDKVEISKITESLSIQNGINEFCIEEKEEKKKDEEANDLKTDLVSLADSMNKFNLKYDRNMLSMIYDNNPDSLLVEEDINSTELSYKSLGKNLQDIKNYVVLKTKPNVNEYKTWDINTAIMWIKSLDDGKFIKYCDLLRKGFEMDQISPSELPSISQDDLATDPFNIRAFMDRKSLAKHFKELENQIANADEGGCLQK